MVLNITIEFNSYADEQVAASRGIAQDLLSDILMKEAIDGVINPDFSRRHYVRVTDVTLESYKALPLSMPNSFADIRKQMGKDYET